MRILLAEDNAEMRSFLRSFLWARGHEVTDCPDGSSAWKAFHAEPFPLVILDWTMPGLDGLEVCQHIRAHPGGALVVIQMITGETSHERIRDLLDGGASDFLIKPISLQDLGLRTTILEHRVAEMARLGATLDALDRRQKELRNTMERISDGFVATNLKRRYTYVNPQAGRMLGRDPESLLGKEMGSVFPEGGIDPLIRACSRAIQTGEPQHQALFYDPWQKWFETRVYPSEDGLSIFFQDITVRKQEEAALLEALHLMDEAQTIAHLGFWSWSLRDDKVTWSSELYRIYGLDPQEFAASLQGYAGLLHPEDRDRVLGVVEEARRAQKPFAFEERIVRPGGEVRSLRSRGNVKLDPAGNAVGMFGTCLDITDLVQAQSALRQKDAQLEMAYRAGRVGLWEWIPDTGQVTWSDNVEAIFGLEPSSFEGTHDAYLKLLHEDDRQMVEERIQHCLETDEPYSVEHRIRLSNGSIRWLLGKGEIFRDRLGKAERMAGSVVDVTDAKRLEENLRQTQKLESLGLLAGGVAHDFNNLLTAMLGNLNLAQMDLPGASSAQSRLKTVEETILRAGDLARQMLAYSGRASLTNAPVDLNALTRETDRLVGSAISRKISLEYHLQEDLPRVMGDKVQLEQVLMNLVINAADAIGSGEGTILVSTRRGELDSNPGPRAFVGGPPRKGLYSVLEVRDTGSGMQEEVLARVFDPFFTTKATGHGLGLSALLGIVKSHHGGVQVESRLGEGTVFTLWLPAANLIHVLQDSLAPAQTPWRGEGTVLVVDDEADVRDAASAELLYMGFNPITAFDGVSALDLYRKRVDKIRIVLMDLSMPRMDGLETLRALFEVDPDVKVILWSGSRDVLTEALAAERGVVALMAKPFSYHDLESALRKALES